MTATVSTLSAWAGIAVYAVASAVHVALLAIDSPAAYPTKLLLMPLLLIAVVWALRGTAARRHGSALTLLCAAIALSWIGDGAAFFLPMLPELPVMLAAFGLAHVAYMILFARHLAVRPVPWWTLVYALWWIVLIIALWPLLGNLAVPVAAYGLVLGGTATLAGRCARAVVIGGACFLASDTILALRLFVPDAPGWLPVAVMVTYTLAQGLIAWGAVRGLREGR